jgi:hypothetical protein
MVKSETLCDNGFVGFFLEIDLPEDLRAAVVIHRIGLVENRHSGVSLPVGLGGVFASPRQFSLT